MNRTGTLVHGERSSDEWIERGGRGGKKLPRETVGIEDPDIRLPRCRFRINGSLPLPRDAN